MQNRVKIVRLVALDGVKVAITPFLPLSFLLALPYLFVVQYYHFVATLLLLRPQDYKEKPVEHD